MSKTVKKILQVISYIITLLLGGAAGCCLLFLVDELFESLDGVVVNLGL
jgi:hypothetical protein